MENLITKTKFDTHLKTLENKIPNVSNLVTKTYYAAAIAKIKNDYVTNAALDARHKDLVEKIYFDAELKKIDDKTSTNSSKVLAYKHKLKQREDIIHGLERDASYFRGKDYLEENYLIFESDYNYFKRVVDSSNITYAHYWQSKGLSNEKINAANTNTNNDLAPIVKFNGSQMYLEFKGAILKQNKVTYSHGSVVNIYIVYKLKPHINANKISQ